MNCLGGGERHNAADYQASSRWSADPDTAPPGDAFLLGTTRPGDVRGFIHRSFIGRAVGGVVSRVVGSVPLVGGLAAGLFDTLRGAGGAGAVPQATQCPPGFVLSSSGCTPRASLGGGRVAIGALGVPGRPFSQANGRAGTVPQPTRMQAGLRTELGFAVDPAVGEPVMGRFGAGFEPGVETIDTRRCGRGAVLGLDGICYNKRDLRNTERFWPRGRRPLLTGGELRAISTASSAAKKLQRKQKQLEGLGFLKKPASRSRRALPAGHTATLAHGSEH